MFRGSDHPRRLDLGKGAPAAAKGLFKTSDYIDTLAGIAAACPSHHYPEIVSILS